VRNRILALLAVALIAVSSLAVVMPALAQSPEDTGQRYDLETLQRGGLEKAQGPDSQRWLSNYGSAVLKYTPVGPLRSDWKYLQQGTLIHADELTLKTVRLAPDEQIDRTLNVTIVAWERGERKVVQGNQTVTRPAAVNQTVHRQQVSLNRGYDNATLDLPDNLHRTAEVTIWIEEYPDARWRFQHHGLPTQEHINIDSQGDALGYAGMYALLPGLLAVVAGIYGGRRTLSRTATGPRIGLALWFIAGGILLAGIFSYGYFQLSVVLSTLPFLVAAPLLVVSYGMTLWAAGAPKRIGFERLDLETVRDGPESAVLTAEDDQEGRPMTDGGQPADEDEMVWQEKLETLNELAEQERTNGDRSNGHSKHDAGTGLREIKEARYVDLVELPAKETPDGEILVPKGGIMPFFARLFADPARLTKKDLMMKVPVDKGRLDEKILVDPDSEQVVDHKPASIRRRWPALHKLDEDDSRVRHIVGMLGALGIVAGLPAVGWVAGGQVGIPAIGALLGVLPAIVMGHTAVDGSLDFEPAPQHFARARDTLVDLQREHKDAKHIKDVDAEASKERARTAKEAMEYRDNTSRSLVEVLMQERAGIEFDDATPEAPEGDADEGGEADE